MSKRDRDRVYITYDFKHFDRLFADQAKLRLYLQSYCLLSLIIILYDTSRIVSGKTCLRIKRASLMESVYQKTSGFFSEHSGRTELKQCV